jgi:hypothetical protein
MAVGISNIFCSAKVRDFKLTWKIILKYKVRNSTCVSELYNSLLETLWEVAFINTEGRLVCVLLLPDYRPKELMAKYL